MPIENYTTAFTYENLSILEKAIASGTKRVKYSDKEIEYRSMAEMIQAYNVMSSALKGSNKNKKTGFFGGRRKVARHSKGLNDGGTVKECFNGYGDDGDI